MRTTAALLLLLFSGCHPARSCRPGTVFLSIAVDSTSSTADSLRITLAVAGQLDKTFVQTKPAGSALGVEIQFSSGYPAGTGFSVTVEALSRGAVTGSGTQSMTLAPGCTAFTVDVSSTSDADSDGGSDGASSDLAGDGFSPDLATADVAVVQHHNSSSRDGLYIDAALTKAALTTLHRDLQFVPSFTGHVSAQPLFVGRQGAGDQLLVFTDENHVYSLDAATGALQWNKALAAPAPKSAVTCANLDPIGITGTPVIDLAANLVYVAALTTPDGGTTVKHLVYALSLADGSFSAPWPIDVAAVVPGFTSVTQAQGGALALANGRLYVPYSETFGECGPTFHGWVVAFPLSTPTQPTFFQTAVKGGGVEGSGGVTVDGTTLFVATGNTPGAATWADGEAFLHLQGDASFDGQTKNYFAPTNWMTLDNGDIDFGDSGATLFSMGARQLIFGLGKDGNAYLADRTNLGGVGSAFSSSHVVTTNVPSAPAAFHSAQGQFVVVAGAGVGCAASPAGALTALKIGAGTPPAITFGWCADPGGGAGSPIVTSPDGISDPVVWVLGIGGDNRLHAFDGNSGSTIFTAASGDALASVQRQQLPIVAKGRIYVVGDGNAILFRP